MSEATQLAGGMGVLRRFVRRPLPVETCDMCGRGLGAAHQHLLEVGSRKVICACDACSILFHGQGQEKYKRIPRRIRFLAGFHMTDCQWESLLMPINMAFFFRSTPLNRVVALYPSPAGATESLLTLDAWDEIELDNPVLAEMESDVEALLVNRIGHARGFSGPEHYLVPIDECFRLVGLIRSRWQGLSGGTEVWREIGGFFEDLKSKSPKATGGSPA